jgi:hypothetical protein
MLTSVILSVRLDGYEILSLTLREESKLRMLREGGAEENVWAQGGGSNRTVNKING